MGKSQNGKSLLPRHRPWSKLLLPNHGSGNFVPGSVLTPWPDSQMKGLLFCVRQYKFLNLRTVQAALKDSYTHDLTNVGYHKPLWEVQGQVPEIAHRVKWLTVKITCKNALKMTPMYSRLGLYRNKADDPSLGDLLNENCLCSNLSAWWAAYPPGELRNWVQQRVDRWLTFLISLHWMDFQYNHSHTCMSDLE